MAAKQPPRHACRFTENTGNKTTCMQCGNTVPEMGCENPLCISTAPGWCRNCEDTSM